MYPMIKDFSKLPEPRSHLRRTEARVEAFRIYSFIPEAYPIFCCYRGEKMMGKIRNFIYYKTFKALVRTITKQYYTSSNCESINAKTKSMCLSLPAATFASRRSFAMAAEGTRVRSAAPCRNSGKGKKEGG